MNILLLFEDASDFWDDCLVAAKLKESGWTVHRRERLELLPGQPGDPVLLNPASELWLQARSVAEPVGQLLIVTHGISINRSLFRWEDVMQSQGRLVGSSSSTDLRTIG